MSVESIPAARLPEVRTRLVEELTPVRRGTAVVESYVLHASARAQIPADPRIFDSVEQALLLARNERDRLANAALFWVSPAMTTLTLAAAPGMPPFRPAAEDLPSPYGLIYFAAPLEEFTEDGAVDQIGFSDGTVMDIPHGQQYEICAATWGPYNRCGAWPAGGTWFSFYTSRDVDRQVDRILVEYPGMGLQAAERHARRQPELTVDNECALSSTHDQPGRDPLFDLARQPGKTSHWVHLTLTAFRLMATAKAATLVEETSPRPVRRRAKRAGVTHPDEPVRLVDITARPTRSNGAGPVDGARAYSVRWTVNGHWRNQWYARSEVHRPKWIDGYVKGPEGAPLKAKETVHLWRDPADGVRP